MLKRKDFSAAEFEVMKVLWDKGASTAKEIQKELSKRKTWRYTTVLTFIARLYDKGYLNREKKEAVYVYSPAHPQKKMVGRLVQNFIDRVFNGEIAPLMNYLSESKNLKPHEIAALKALITVLDKEGKDVSDT